VIKSTGDHSRQVVIRRNFPQALPKTGQFTGPEQFVSARASGKLDVGMLQKI
jgi:hypothetical protein